MLLNLELSNVFAVIRIRALLAMIAVAHCGCKDSPEQPVPPKQTRGAPRVAVAQPPPPPTPPADPLKHLRPIQETREDFVSSEQCRECHQSNHASWHASYHRTMTQVAHADTVMGTFTNQVVSVFGGKENYQMFVHEGLPWMKRLENNQAIHPPGLENAVPAVLTTGSHHMQVYWSPTGEGRELNLMPLVYLKQAERWIPRDAAFLLPPQKSSQSELGRWNQICIQCHTTDGRNHMPQSADEAIETKASEFGISCEACHGPGKQHIAYHKLEATDEARPKIDPIVNPAELDHQRSAQVCGGCHSVSANHGEPDEWVQFRAGRDLEKERIVFDRTPETLGWLAKYNSVNTNDTSKVEEAYGRWFWEDGVARVSGREYSALRKSGCHTRGEMSCISCHRVHPSRLDDDELKNWADDMLEPHMRGDQSCLQCHEKKEYAVSSHTHHKTDSSGSHCMNCHMPHTNYGLLKAIRDHSVGSPSVKETVELGRPNACNLCHLDKPLKWTNEHLADWYDIKPVELTEDQSKIATGALWTLKGDAGLRALVAWHLGWPEAMNTSGTDWMIPYLANLLNDRYDAVRFIAGRSLEAHREYREFEYDFLATDMKRRLIAKNLLQLWATANPTSGTDRRATLIDDSGKILQEEYDRLLRRRDIRAVVLAE